MSLTKMRRKMSKAVRPLMYLIAAVFVASCFTLYWPSMGGTPAKAQESVVARVNGMEIPRDLYERAVQIQNRNVEMQARFTGGGTGKADLRQYHLARGQAFEAVVDSFLRAQAAEKEGFRVTDAELKQLENQQVEDEMATKLEGATAQEKKQYEAQIRQLFDREGQRRRLLMERLEEKLRARFEPTEADLMASYNEVKARHILIKTAVTNRSEEDGRKLAEQVLAKVKAGGDFVALAKQYSEDPGSKNSGGDVGWITAQSQFVPEFTEAARKLKKGQVSDLVRTMFGFHILKADDVRTKLPKDIKDPKKKAEYLEKFQEETLKNRLQSHYQTLRLYAKIEPIDPFIAGYMSENQALSAQADGSTAEYQALMAQALKNYEAAAARNDLSSGPALHAKLAELYRTLKQDDKALASIDKALESTASSELFVMKGEILEGKKNKAEAVKAYQEASKSAYDQPWLHITLQQKYLALGRKDLAQAEYAKWEKYKQQNGNGSNTFQISPMDVPSLPPGVKKVGG